jgi:hypothetical protein
LLRWHHCFNFSEVAQSLLVQSELLGKVKASWGSREAARMQPTAQAAGGQRTKKKPRHGGKDAQIFLANPDIESSASTYRMSHPSQNISPDRKDITKSNRFRRKSWRFLKKNKVVYDERYIWD